jgi:non-lysosomal glucosylceramidase
MAIRIPPVTWSRALGLGYEPEPRPRVNLPMIDDGPWGGVPIGGIGAGSIGRTQRGDFARWHLRIGEHRFESSPFDGFAAWVGGPDGGWAQVLRTTPPPAGWGEPLPVGAGTYRALFPRAWLEIGPPAVPIRVIEEQLSPIIPGNDAAASLPVGVFEVELQNPGAEPVDAAILLSWTDPLSEALAVDGNRPSAKAVAFEDGSAVGVGFEAEPGSSLPGSFAIAADPGDGVEITTSRRPVGQADPLWAAFSTDGRVDGFDAADGDLIAVAARVGLPAGESRTLRFAVAWDLPIAEFGSGRRWAKRYTREWGTSGRRAPELAAEALRRLPDWRADIERWQAPILEADDRPAWYRAALFNELYYVVDGGTIWPTGEPEPRPSSDGYAELALLECFDYPFYDTLDVHFYAASAIRQLWPRLQASISRAYARTVDIDDPVAISVQATGATGVRKVRGALPHDLGGPAEDPLVRVNHYTFQEVNAWKDLNAKFVLGAWLDRKGDPDPDGFVRETWPAVRQAMDHLARFDRDGDGLPEHEGIPDQTYDTWPMNGPSAYGGSLWLAALRAAAAFARAAGDETAADAWDALFSRARTTFETRLWNGRSYDYDGGSGPSSDTVMADQLVGQWFADVSGLGDLLPPERVRSALRRIFELNVLDFGDGLRGAVNGMRPDGTIDRSSEQSQEVWVGTTYALAAFMIGRGLVEEGWTTAEGAARVVWEQGLWFRTPEAYDRAGNYRASLYLRPLAIWAIEEALARQAASRGVA